MSNGLLQGHKIKISQIIKNAGKTTVESFDLLGLVFMVPIFRMIALGSEQSLTTSCIIYAFCWLLLLKNYVCEEFAMM